MNELVQELGEFRSDFRVTGMVKMPKEREREEERESDEENKVEEVLEMEPSD